MRWDCFEEQFVCFNSSFLIHFCINIVFSWFLPLDLDTQARLITIRSLLLLLLCSLLHFSFAEAIKYSIDDNQNNHDDGDDYDHFDSSLQS